MHRLIAILGAAALVILLGAPSRFPNSQSVKLLCYSGVDTSAGADTTEDVLATCTVPSNSMGANGRLEITADFTTAGAGGNKTTRLRWGAVGTPVGSLNSIQGLSSSSLGVHLAGSVSNRGSASSQVVAGFNIQFSPNGTGMSTSPAATAIDTTASATIVITCAKVSAGDTCTLNDYRVILISDGT